MELHRPSPHANPKYRSKKAASLSSTVCFLAAWPLFLENRDTGGRILVMAVPVAEMLPSRKALLMNSRAASALRFSSAMMRSSSSVFFAATKACHWSRRRRAHPASPRSNRRTTRPLARLSRRRGAGSPESRTGSCLRKSRGSACRAPQESWPSCLFFPIVSWGRSVLGSREPAWRSRRRTAPAGR